MNILFLNEDTANPITGGVQCVSYYLYKSFKARGHQVTMLAWRKVVEDETEDFYTMPDALSLLSEANKDYLDNILKDKKIDVVMNHTCLCLQYSYVLKYLKSKGCKIVSIFHNSLFGVYGYNKYKWLRNLERVKVRTLFDLFIRYGFLIKYRRLFRMQACYSDRIVLLSDKFITEYKFFAGKHFANKLLAIPNPVTITEMPRAEKENILLFVGRLASEKGLPHLLNIWSRLENVFPDWKLQILGGGPEKDFCEQRIKELALQRCELLGFQKPEPYYNKAKIFCMTSLYEGFGLVLVEAMRYGVVPFAFDSYPNVSDIIDDGKNGVLVQPFDVDEYADKIRNLMESPRKLAEMAKNAEYKSQEFSIEKITHQWEMIFSEVINEK